MEHKFRAWDSELNSMVEAGTILQWCFGFAKKGSAAFRKDFSTTTFLQYTGLKDKNGKEIYEGDIVDNGHKHTPSRGVVEFWSASFRVNCQIDSGLFNLALTGQMCSGKVEVIGNIYEDKELLEVKNG